MDQVMQPARSKKNPKHPPKDTLASEGGSGVLDLPSPLLQMQPLDLAEERSRQILAALLAFSDGDFTTRLPTEWSGTDGRIAETFNHTIGNAARITDEAARLSTTVGKEGRLSQRMSSPGAAGSWATQSTVSRTAPMTGFMWLCKRRCGVRWLGVLVQSWRCPNWRPIRSLRR